MTTDQQTIGVNPRVGVDGTTLLLQRDPFLLLGYVFLAASCFFYLLFEFTPRDGDNYTFEVFFCHYILALGYAGFLIYNKAYGIRASWRKANIHKTVVLLNLFLVSAFALNREYAVFETSANWWSVYLVISSMTLMSFQYFERLPAWANKIQFVLLGAALVVYLYAMVFTASYYAFSWIGLLFFGIGGLMYVPVCFVVLVIALIKHYHKQVNAPAAWMIAGVLMPLLFTAAFISEWSRRVDEIAKVTNQSVIAPETELPPWVKAAQTLEDDWMTRRILKSDLVYTTAKDNFLGLDVPRRGAWDEQRKHDPLVLVATAIKECTLPAEERLRILQAITKSRHQAEERLWSGDNLTTSYIVTDVDIYPDLQLAYTEKYLNVNNSGKRGWRNMEEAIYTFQLPEGSVVTSLSLWINGKEEKAILTSKQKATEAYTTIVGHESRDPSVVHWQEGNRVSVRVFPCTPDEERKFKIGITSPLTRQQGQIVYKSILFEGPNAEDARETTRVTFIGTPPKTELPNRFKKNDKGDYISEARYNPELSIGMEATPVKTANTFSFDGYSYSLEPYTPTYDPYKAGAIYLDINTSWTPDEVEAFKAHLGDNLYVFYDDAFVKLNEQNWPIAETLQKRAFSLFPFHLLRKKNTPLVVTKGNAFSVHLSDFKDSPFAVRLSKFFASGKRVHVYNLGETVSPYVGSLREFRALQFSEGSLEELFTLLDKQQFPTLHETENSIVLHDADLQLTRTKSGDNPPPNSAPDHLARLFAYNDIMRRVGPGYFKEDFINETLVEEASKAYVVSPVSSLIVLETQADYDRFNIHGLKNSLQNAAKDSSGAVPEPHEWVLIILFAAFVIYLKVRRA
ncbi:XrtN system VIT domain protein [Chryseolinea serpens]|uniref:XrtN system VIT domain protein n=1 Tax=Chryseolinea serpens TaxID=947013 RepID=A0A1M5QQH4_9BACT|nr:XrtN system VIT domain-containing protein [Chryseolinea serpens]SHH16345.1 XrtN system VIT domain protein [Chryseolinea serpens]